MGNKNYIRNWYSAVIQQFKKSIYDFNQKLYITIVSFLNNDLLTIAASGAYNFLMSAIPIFILTIAILIRVLNRSPSEVKNILATIPAFTNAVDVDRFFSMLKNLSSFSYFEIVVILFTIWMGLRFFSSMQHGIRKVYRKKTKIEPLKVSLILLIAEIIIINAFVLLVIFFSAGEAILKTSFIQNIFSQNDFVYKIYFFLKLFFQILPFIFLHIFIFAIYYFIPPVKPTKKNAFFSSFGCTLVYFVIKVLFSLFRNIDKFTIVYGFFSNVILLLIQVWFFFFFFTFFAQFMYVKQFFKSFVISQLYRMPHTNDKGFFAQLERRLFIQPSKDYRDNAIKITEGEFVYKYDENSTDLYYIIDGTVRVIMPDKIIDLETGNSFGEFSSLLNGKRIGTAIAISDTLLAIVPKEEFLETLEMDSAVSRKALKTLANYLIKN